MEAKVEENAKLKSKLIEQQSELSLKSFYISQKEQQLSTVVKDRE